MYAIRALYRVIQLSKTGVEQYSQELSQVLSKFIQDTAQDENEQSPNYVYILFETTALTVKFLVQNPAKLHDLQVALSVSLNYIIQQNKADLMGFAFQIYALFVASSAQNNDLYRGLTASVLQNKQNWNKDMKYLIPSLGQFLIAMMCKFP